MNKKAYIHGYKEAGVGSSLKMLGQALMPRVKRQSLYLDNIPRIKAVPDKLPFKHPVRRAVWNSHIQTTRPQYNTNRHLKGGLLSRLFEVLITGRSNRFRDLVEKRQARAANRASEAMHAGKPINPKTIQSLRDTSNRLDFANKVERADIGRAIEGSLLTSGGIAGYGMLKRRERNRPIREWDIKKRRDEQQKQGPWTRQ
jgi:hypothetical protein